MLIKCHIFSSAVLENANLHKHSKIQGTTRLLMTPSLNACLLLLAFHLLMQSGDIESNPGPSGECTSFVANEFVDYSLCR